MNPREECNRCGKCCVAPPDGLLARDELLDAWLRCTRAYDGECRYLLPPSEATDICGMRFTTRTERLCAIYDRHIRPQFCRDFPAPDMPLAKIQKYLQPEYLPDCPVLKRLLEERTAP